MKKKKEKVFLPKFKGAKSRVLELGERSFSTSDSDVNFPIVIEPRFQEEQSRIKEFLYENSEDIKAALHLCGALLFRGWDIASESDFEESAFSIQGIIPLEELMRTEPGRTLVPGSKCVHYTNTEAKTGGSFQTPGFFFHSENFYQPEVPGYQFFWCKKPSLLGGETGLIQMGHAYQRLIKPLREVLERERVFARSWPLFQLSQLYQMDEKFLERILKQQGFEIQIFDGRKYLVLFKPAVFRHPVTGKCALQINFKETFQTSQIIRDLLIPHYSGPQWFFHRMAWTHSKIRSLLAYLDEALVKITGAKTDTVEREYPNPEQLNRFRIGRRLSPKDANDIGRAMVDHCTVFRWFAKDLLFIDNTQVLHCGMPGFGPRELRVIMSNSLPIEYPIRSGTLNVDLENPPQESLRTILLKAKRSQSKHRRRWRRRNRHLERKIA